MARERTRTRPLFVPTQRVGEVEVVFSMKVEEKWRDLTRLPSSAMTLRSGCQKLGDHFHHGKDKKSSLFECDSSH